MRPAEVGLPAQPAGVGLPAQPAVAGLPAQPAVPPWRRHLRSLPWSSCSPCAWRGSPRCRCRCGALTPRARLLDWRHVVMVPRPRASRNALRQTVRPCSCGLTGSSSSRPSRPNRRYCRASPSRRRPSPRPNLAKAERGSASLVAVAMMAVLFAITTGGVYVGSAVIARHRAQAAADLAALAAAVHLADGTACTQASAVARAMRTAVTQCVVEDLDVIVTVDAPLAVGRMGVGPARAAARAGPADTGS